jgi:hypothetical protein
VRCIELARPSHRVGVGVSGLALAVDAVAELGQGVGPGGTIGGLAVAAIVGDVFVAVVVELDVPAWRHVGAVGALVHELAQLRVVYRDFCPRAVGQAAARADALGEDGVGEPARAVSEPATEGSLMEDLVRALGGLASSVPVRLLLLAVVGQHRQRPPPGDAGTRDCPRELGVHAIREPNCCAVREPDVAVGGLALRCQ